MALQHFVFVDDAISVPSQLISRLPSSPSPSKTPTKGVKPEGTPGKTPSAKQIELVTNLLQALKAMDLDDE